MSIKKKRPARVRFIGDPEYYKLSCAELEWTYCRDCDNKGCSTATVSRFYNGKIYNAYFLEYWQGERNSLHVMGEDGIIDDYIPLADFEIVEDADGVLGKNEAIVRCVSSAGDDEFGITFGKEYKALGVNKNGAYLIMDNSTDCYFYSKDNFEIVSDPCGVLDPETSGYVYDFHE